MTVPNWTEVCDESCCADQGDPMAALRDLGRYSQTWTWGDLIEKEPDEVLTRAAMERQLAARAHEDGLFRETLRTQTRYAYMVAVHNAFLIPKLDFLRQIREVRLLEETRELLFFVLPARSELQALLEERSASLDNPSDAEISLGRSQIEARMVEHCGKDQAFRRALLFEPASTYTRFARQLSRRSSPSFLDRIREVRIIPETQDSLAFALPFSENSSVS